MLAPGQFLGEWQCFAGYIGYMVTYVDYQGFMFWPPVTMRLQSVTKSASSASRLAGSAQVMVSEDWELKTGHW